MRLMVRAALVIATAAGFCAALALTASADVVDPSSVYQPASSGLLQKEKPRPAGEESDAQPSRPELWGESSPAVAEASDEVPATPAPEPQVGPAPAHIVNREPAPQTSALERALRPFKTGFAEIGSYLGRVVDACQVAAGAGAGGPVLVLAVLSLAIALDRHRVLGARLTTDEDVPELLYATEVIAPG